MKICTRWLTAFALIMSFAAEAQAQTAVEITFTVDMTAPLANGSFIPGTDFVTVAGDMNGWDNTADTLAADQNDPNLYTGVVRDTLATVPATIGFKFVIKSDSDGDIWEGDPNREVTITGTEPDSDSNGSLEVEAPVDFFDRVDPGSQTASFLLEFRVNMAVAITQGRFDPAEDVVTVAGGAINNWNNIADTLTSDFLDPDVYFKLIEVSDLAVPTEIEFKFILHDIEEGADPIIGWEGLPNNRKHTLTGDEGQPNNEGFIEVSVPEVFFDNISFDDVFAEETEVFIEVDARPAMYFLTDSLFLPQDAQTGDPVTDFSGIFANGPFVSPVGWEDWGPDGLGSIEELQLLDNGENGDLVKGDSVFTMSITKAAGAAKRGVVKFGVNGFDNEAPAGADRIVTVDEANPRVSLVFGAVIQEDGRIGDDNAINGMSYDAYILVDNSTTPATATVVRRGGEVDGIATDTELGVELPSKVTLLQNYPNPFSRTATIEYELEQSGRVTLQVFDMLGREVMTLFDGLVPAARHAVEFDASKLAGGTYIYRLQTEDQVATRTMIVLK